MRSSKKGFTILEVMLFIAITGLLVAGIIASTGGAISQQRYNDSVQSFAEFLRGVYSSVNNPQGVKNGRSDSVIYGKLVTFGEEYDTEGKKNSSNKIFTYDIIGNADEISTGNVLSSLTAANARVLIAGGTNGLTYAGSASTYLPQWDAKIQVTGSATNFAGSIMIVRAPSTGTIYTFSTNTVIQVNKVVWIKGTSTKDPLTTTISSFADRELDFCVAAADDKTLYGGKRRNIHLDKGSHDASAVETISLDSTQNKCKKL